MNPNQEQWLSLIRLLLGVGGPVSAWLISRGIPADQVTALSTSIIAVVGALPPLISFVWGMLAHTDANAIKVVTAMPDVKKIEVSPLASDGVGTALADPLQPKVVSASSTVAAAFPAGTKPPPLQTGTKP